MPSGQPFRGRRASLIASRLAVALFAAVTAAATATCGGSTAVETVVGPGGVRCQTTLSNAPPAVEPDGGSISVTVNASRDCTWNASTDASWMQLGATSGQGNGTVAVTVARNDQPSARNGAVIVNDQRVSIAQQPRPCAFELRAISTRMSSTGGRGAISVSTISGCSWTATSSTSWLHLLNSTGNGAGTIDFEVAANMGAAREGSIGAGGQSVTIGQDGASDPAPQPNCTVTLSPSIMNAVAAGGAQTVSIAIGGACDWSATSNASWLTFASPRTGRGPGTLSLVVARNTGSARSATVSVGQQTATVNQAGAPACTVTIDSATASFSAAGGEGRVRVTTTDGCEWTAGGSGVAWIDLPNQRGTTSGDVRYTVAANTTTTGRSATITIAGRSHSVTQNGATPTCTYSIDPVSRSFSAAGGTGSATVNTQGACQWNVSSAPDWVNVQGGQGTGTNPFSYTVLANRGGARSGAIVVNGETHTVNQEAAAPICTFSLQPTSQNSGAGGGTGQFTVTTQANCSWSAATSADWVTVTSTSPTSVSFSVAANTATSPRQTTITVTSGSSSATFSVTQDAAAPTCTYSIQPTSQNFGASGSTGQFTVTTQANCSWSATRGADWVTVTSTSPTSVSFSVAANTATSPRQTTITVTGGSSSATFSVTQDAAAAPPPPPSCTYSIDSASQRFSRAGGEGVVRVTTGPSCTWTASSPVGWILVGPASSMGSGEVRYSVAPSSEDRSATISIAGQSHRVDQQQGS